MDIAIVITHNKGAARNAAQIEALKPFIIINTESHDELDADGNVVGQFETYYYTLLGLPGYRVRFYQIFPFGVTPPANKDDIDSHKVFYGKGDEDKTGDHPRFFNWGLKRATDYGAEAVLLLDDVSKISTLDLLEKMEALTTPADPTEYAEAAYGRMATQKLLREVGQMKEDRSFNEAIVDLKGRINNKGMGGR